MLQHITNAHPNLLPSASDDKKKTSGLHKFGFKSTPRSSDKISFDKDAIDQCLEEFVVGTLVPLSLVDKGPFLKFVHALNPSYSLPCAKTLTDKLKKRFKELKDELLRELKEAEFVSITHDSWTSLATVTYETVTVHYISTKDGKWELKSKVWETSTVGASHTAEDIAAYLQSVKTRWCLPEVVATSDNAAVEVKTFTTLGWKRLGCFGHLINLIVKKFLANQRPKNLCTKSRSMVSYFHKSPQANTILKAKQTLLNMPERSLLQDVVTRWNSTHDMLERICQQMPALVAVATDKELKIKIKDLRPFLLTFDEQLYVEEMLKILSTFKKASELMSGDKHPTLPMVLPTLQTLKSVLVSESETEAFANLKKNMLDDLEKRFQERETYEIACMVDPGLKGWICSIMGVDKVKDVLVRIAQTVKTEEGVTRASIHVKKEKSDDTPEPALPMLAEMGESMEMKQEVADDGMERTQRSESEEEAEEVPALKKIKKEISETKPSTSFASFLGDVIFIKEETPKADDQALKDEVDLFLREVIPGKKALEKGFSLKWWEGKVGCYPNIARVARKYLCVPASSVPTERIWSLAGNIVTKKRAALKSENIDMLIFLNYNMA